MTNTEQMKILEKIAALIESNTSKDEINKIISDSYARNSDSSYFIESLQKKRILL